MLSLSLVLQKNLRYEILVEFTPLNKFLRKLSEENVCRLVVVVVVP